MTKPTQWRHARKGLITGHVVKVIGDWTWVKVVGEHEPRMNAIANQGVIWKDGEVVRLRTILLEEL